MRNPKKMVSFFEDIDIIHQIGVVALQEGSDRSAIIRRAIRKELVFLGAIPTNGNIPTDKSHVSQEQPL